MGGAGALILLALVGWIAWGNAGEAVAPALRAVEGMATTLRHDGEPKPIPGETRVEVRDTTGTSEAAAAGTPGEVVVTLRWADDDAPVVGHEVLVTDEWTDGALRRVAGARTDVGGVVKVPLAAGEWYVMVERDVGRRVRVRAGVRVEVALSLPRGSVLVGRVVDERDVAVAGATVFEVRGTFGGEPRAIATSDTDGAFRAQLVRGGALLVARKPGYGASAVVNAYGEGDAEVRIELVLAATTTSLRGRVVDVANQPIAGAKVALMAWAPRPRRGPAIADASAFPVAHTDPEGAFAFEDVAVGEGMWYATAPGRRSARDRFVASPGVVAEVRVVLAPGARVVGRVVDGEGKPVTGVSVGIERRPVPSDVRTGADGRFALDVEPGPVELIARSRVRGAVRVALEIAEREQREVDLHLREDPVLHGRVVDERGAPLSGLWVTCWPGLPGEGPRVQSWQPFSSDATDEDGSFRIVACAEESLLVRVREAGLGSGAVLARAEGVRAGGAPLVLVVRDAARPSAFLRIRVDDPAHPERPLELTLRNLDTGDEEFLAFAPGRVRRLGPLAPGSYRLRHLHAYHPERPILGLDLGPIVLVAHDERDLGTHVLLPTTSLALTLRRSDGSLPRTGLPLRLVPADGSPTIIAMITDRREVYPFSFLPGRYRVEVPGWADFEAASAEVELREGQTTPLTIELPALRPCSMHLRLPEGRHPPAEVSGELRVEGGGPRPLTFHSGRALVGLRPGEYTAVVDTDGCRGRARFTVDSVVREPLRVDVPAQ